MTGSPGGSRPPEIPRPAAVAQVASPLIAQFAATLAIAPVNRKSAKLQSFWAYATSRGTPLTEPASVNGQHIVTFLFRGPTDDYLAAVDVIVDLGTDQAHLNRTAMIHLDGTDIWSLSYQVDDGWQSCYCFYPVTGDQAAEPATNGDPVGIRHRLDSGLPDPLNLGPVHVHDGRTMSMVRLPQAPPST